MIPDPTPAVAEWEPAYTLDRQIAEAFAKMTPERRAQLEAEWNQPEQDRKAA